MLHHMKGACDQHDITVDIEFDYQVKVVFVTFLNCTVDISLSKVYFLEGSHYIHDTKFGELCLTSWGRRVENICIKFFGIILHICVFFHLFIYSSVCFFISESLSVMPDSLQPHGLCKVHGILQARMLEWVAFPFSRGPSQPRDQTQVSHIAGRFFNV